VNRDMRAVWKKFSAVLFGYYPGIGRGGGKSRKYLGFETWTSRKRSRISTQSIGALSSGVIKNYT